MAKSSQNSTPTNASTDCKSILAKIDNIVDGMQTANNICEQLIGPMPDQEVCKYTEQSYVLDRLQRQVQVIECNLGMLVSQLYRIADCVGVSSANQV